MIKHLQNQTTKTTKTKIINILIITKVKVEVGEHRRLIMVKYGQALHDVIKINYPKYVIFSDRMNEFFQCMDDYKLSYRDLRKMGFGFNTIEANLMTDRTTIIQYIEDIMAGLIPNHIEINRIISTFKFPLIHEGLLTAIRDLPNIDQQLELYQPMILPFDMVNKEIKRSTYDHIRYLLNADPRHRIEYYLTHYSQCKSSFDSIKYLYDTYTQMCQVTKESAQYHFDLELYDLSYRSLRTIGSTYGNCFGTPAMPGRYWDTFTIVCEIGMWVLYITENDIYYESLNWSPYKEDLNESFGVHYVAHIEFVISSLRSLRDLLMKHNVGDDDQMENCSDYIEDELIQLLINSGHVDDIDEIVGPWFDDLSTDNRCHLNNHFLDDDVIENIADIVYLSQSKFIQDLDFTHTNTTKTPDWGTRSRRFARTSTGIRSNGNLMIGNV